MKACKNNRKDTVLLLLEDGADWSVKDKYGDTVLDSAIEFERHEIAALIKKSCKKNG